MVRKLYLSPPFFRKLYSSPPSFRKWYLSPACNKSFFGSHCTLFAFLLPCFAFIFHFKFPFSLFIFHLIVFLSPFFLFLLHFPLFLFPLSYRKSPNFDHFFNLAIIFLTILWGLGTLFRCYKHGRTFIFLTHNIKNCVFRSEIFIKFF